MPSVPDEFVPFRTTAPTPAIRPEPAPGSLETIESAGALFNWPYRSVRDFIDRFGAEYDPTHDPMSLIKGTKYASDPGRFARSYSETETRAIMREWDADEHAADIYQRSGSLGTVAALGAGLLDPTIFLPIAKVFTGAKAGVTALRLAGDTALTGALASSISEAGMASTTPHYTAGDFARGVGTATVLSGLLGGALGALLSRGEAKAIQDGLHAFREDWGNDIAQGFPQSAGAATADTRQLEMARTGIEKIDPTARVSPPRRVLNSPFVSARRTVADLVETPYLFKENREGIATTQGPALDRLARLEINKSRIALTDVLTDTFTRYRFNGQADVPKTQRMFTHMMDIAGRPREKMSYPEFKDAIDDALRNSDKHDIPEVAEAAGFIRRTIVNPWKDRAIKAGLLPEDVDAGTAASYMMRHWNKQRVIAARPELVRISADWLESEQARKAGIQTNLQGLAKQLDEAEAKAAKLEASVRATDDAKIAAADDVAQLRKKVEKELTEWKGKSAAEAISAIARREKAAEGRAEDAPRLKEADKTVSKVLQRIIDKNSDLSRQELESRANEIIDRIVGSPDGRLAYDAPSGGPTVGVSRGPRQRGPLASREFMIPDHLIRQFLHTDVEQTAIKYLETMVPDILLTEKFGDVDMTDAFRRLHDESAAMQMAAKSPAERAKIAKQADAAEADLAAMRDRIRHTYGYSSDPRAHFWGRMAQLASRYDTLSNLGGVLLSQVADIATTQMRYGLASQFRNAWIPMARALMNPELRKAVGAQRRQFKALGIAAETYLASRANSLHNIVDTYSGHTKIESTISAMADKFPVATMLAQFTDFTKLAAGMVSSAEISHAVEKAAIGKASAKQITDLAEAGIDAAMATRIWSELSKEGGSDLIADIRISNTGNWTDHGARQAFEGALARDSDLMVVTPGAERPLMMSRPVAALILQYKSFVVAANERILIRGLQLHDANVLQYVVSATALGMLGELGYSYITDRDLPATPADWVKQGVSRSGMLGWLHEGNAIASKWTGGTADAYRLMGATRPDSRYISRSKWGAVLGPTAGKLENLLTVASDVANGTWTAQDTTRMRRLMIGQNLFYLRRLLDLGEEEVNESLGVEQRK